MITNKNIYSTALGMIGTDLSEGDTTDYEERAPYLIASFCCLARVIDKKLRRRDGLTAQTAFSPVFLDLNSQFPLCEALAPAASLYLAAMLVIEENSSLSDSLYDKYCDCIASVTAELEELSSVEPGSDESDGPYAVCESICNKYFFD